MTIDYKIWDFPTLDVRSQLFHAPGQAFEGGFTSGGVRVTAPEPGGRAYLEVELSLQVNEWDAPFASWIMSKINGDIFRVPLVRTPQVVSTTSLDLGSEVFGLPWAQEGQYLESAWDNDENWSYGDLPIPVTSGALEGSTVVTVDLSEFGQVLKIGHVIGFDDSSYLVDEIEYDDNSATITVKPPFRKDIAVDDEIKLRPVFTGSISNGAEIRAAYEAQNVGYVQPARIIFTEVII